MQDDEVVQNDEVVLLWRVIHHILLHAKPRNLGQSNPLPKLVWFIFEEFNKCYQDYLKNSDNPRDQEALPKYILARPLIGSSSSEHEHINTSPLFTSLPKENSLDQVRCHAHLFRMYVGLSDRLRDLTNGDEGAIARRTMEREDHDYFCHVFARSEAKIFVRPGQGIEFNQFKCPTRFSEELEKRNISWPQPDVTLDNLSDTTFNYEAAYIEKCEVLDRELFQLLKQNGDRESDGLVAWWLYQANADLLLFRGFDEGNKINPEYPWGGIWFLVNSKLGEDHLRALSLLVHECMNIATVEMRAKDRERANIGAGMFHNLAHYIFPLRQYGSSITRYAERGDWKNVRATAAEIETTVVDLDLFQSEVQELLKFRQSRGRISSQSLQDVPHKAISIQTRATHTALRLLGEHHNAPMDPKYVALLRDLCPGAENLDPGLSDDRKELARLIMSNENLASFGQNELPRLIDTAGLVSLWEQRFGINLRVEGDFESVRGNFVIITSVLGELFFNALGGAAKVLADARKCGQDKNLIDTPHIIFEASRKNDGISALYIKNLSLEPLNSDYLFREPEGDRGWGLYGMQLLVKSIGGQLNVWENRQKMESWTGTLMFVGIELVPSVGSNDAQTTTSAYRR